MSKSSTTSNEAIHFMRRTSSRKVRFCMTNQEENEPSEPPAPVEDADHRFKFANDDFTTATLAIERSNRHVFRLALTLRFLWKIGKICVGMRVG